MAIDKNGKTHAIELASNDGSNRGQPKTLTIQAIDFIMFNIWMSPITVLYVYQNN